VQVFIAELHVHTVLSPCAEIEMIPPLIVQAALEKSISLLAITDHNASANVEAVVRAAAGTPLAVLPGMEVQTREEVHMLCLFDNLAQLAAWQSEVDGLLPDQENNVELFGEQFVVDEMGEFIRREPRLLLTSADISLEDAVARVRALGGLAIPAHIDRRAFSLIANLGLVPPRVPFAALEITRCCTPEQARQQYLGADRLPIVQNGDVHRLEEMLGATMLTMRAPTIAEMQLALNNLEKRALTLRGQVI
jgi:hypothetical protein